MISTRIDEWYNDIENLTYVSDNTWLMCESYATGNFDMARLPENGWY